MWSSPVCSAKDWCSALQVTNLQVHSHINQNHQISCQPHCLHLEEGELAKMRVEQKKKLVVEETPMNEIVDTELHELQLSFLKSSAASLDDTTAARRSMHA